MDRIRAIAFDIDGTLYADSTLYGRSIGFALSHMRFIRTFSAIRNTIRVHGTVVDNLYDYQAQQLAAIRHIHTTIARDTIDNIIYTTWMQKIASTPLLSGVHQVLQYLQDKDVPCGIISDFPVAQKIKQWNIEEYFQVVIESERCGTLKPHSKPFHLLSNQLNIPTQQILYIGNSFKNDIVGAHNAGAQALHLAPRQRTRSYRPQLFSHNNKRYVRCVNYPQVMEYLATLFE